MNYQNVKRESYKNSCIPVGASLSENQMCYFKVLKILFFNHIEHLVNSVHKVLNIILHRKAKAIILNLYI